jgi:hypothetical protein
MPEDEPTPQFEKWLSIGGKIIAPTTAVTTLLFYFGYVSSRAQYDYFGVDVDTVGLTTQDYVMRSPQPLLVPMLVLTLLSAALVAGHTAVRRRMNDSARYRQWFRRGVEVGLVLVAIGVVLLFVYPLISEWDYYPLVTPSIFAVGGALAGYGLTMLRRLPPAPADSGMVQIQTSRLVIVLIWVAVAAGVFWATATVAQWSGRGLGQEQARHLHDLPSVILDTQERLFLPSGSGVREHALNQSSEQQEFHYRYWKLRLLIQGDDAMFLVPDTWSAGNTTLMVPLDGNVRVQFQFRNLAP